MQTRTRHSAHKCHRFDGNGLAACIRPGDDHTTDPSANLKIQRHTALLFQHRVSGAFQLHIMFQVDLRLRPLHFQTQLSFGKHKIQLFNYPDILQQRCLPLSGHIGEGIEYFTLLGVLLNPVYFQIFPEIGHSLRLDEQRGTRGRLLHHTARNHGPAFFFHRDAESSVSGDYERII